MTVPDDVTAGTTALGVGVAYTLGGTARTTGATYSVTAIPKGLVYISDLPFVSATNGYGPVERDTNVGGSGAGDGTPITIKGVTYTKGLGTNSISSVVIAVPAGCHTFTSDVGVDDSAGGKGSVVFSVLVDGTTVVTTPTLKGGQAAVPLSVDVTGASQLTLNVGDAGDGNGHDNADWAGAQFACTD